jgi:hypothetical protein
MTVNTRIRQTGAFILVTVIFLMVAGGAMLYAMANLSTVSSATNSLAHNGNMALAAAQSGLKYCLLVPVGCPDNTPTNLDIPAIPCKITVGRNATCIAASSSPPSICTMTSEAICPNVTTCPNAADPYCGAKKLSIQVQKSIGGYQMIPASRQILP